MKTRKLTIVNIDGVETHIKDEDHFIEFMSVIFDENEEFTDPEAKLVKPTDYFGFQAYLNTCCGNLELVWDEVDTEPYYAPTRA